MAIEDRRGVVWSAGDDASIELYEQALAAFTYYRGDPVAIIDRALAARPDFVLGEIFRAYMHVGLWEKSAMEGLSAGLVRLEALATRSNDHERAHMAALTAWAAGDWQGLRGRLDRILMAAPRDLMALQIGHLADFFMGDRDNLRGRVARALPAWRDGEAGYGLVLGMHAFGHEECGDYRRAEAAARQALDIDAEDCWARHALAHVMEMEGRQAEGARFMEESARHWAQDDNVFAYHNWWHTALYHLDQGDAVRALALYDEAIRPGPEALQVNQLDGVAMLWRLHLQGTDLGARWQPLAERYEALGEAGFYAFNDMHMMMAYCAAGNGAAADHLLAAAERAAEAADDGGEMQRRVGLSVLRAIAAFARGDYAACAALLLPVRYAAHAFGGSHAQRDILHRTLIEAALRGGDKVLARALADERLASKPDCPYGLALRARAEAL